MKRAWIEFLVGGVIITPLLLMINKDLVDLIEGILVWGILIFAFRRRI